MFGLLYGSAVLLTGCGLKTETTRPLVDSQHAADVLVERHVLSNAVCSIRIGSFGAGDTFVDRVVRD